MTSRAEPGARPRVRRLATPVLDLVRRGDPVAWTPSWMGFGNQAYLWFWAWRGRSRGERRTVLRTAAMHPWLDLFPEGRALTTAREDVRFLDRRLGPRRLPADDGAPPFTPDWRPEELRGFITEVLLSSRAFRRLVEEAHVEPRDVVVNIRRGDYYTAANAPVWGFDQAGYVRRAWASVGADAPDRVLVVSDDPAWCRRELGWLTSRAPVVEFAPSTEGPQRNLATLAAAHRLVLTNSTFSYWGGYLGDALAEGGRTVVAPRLFNRSVNDGRSWLLDPAWEVVEDPGPSAAALE